MPAQTSPSRSTSRRVTFAALAAAVAALVVVIVLAFSNAAGSADAGNGVWHGGGADGVAAPSLADVETPAAADERGGIPVSAAGVGVAGDGDVVVEVFYDLLCPWCARFEEQFGPELDAAIEAGGVTVVDRPVAFLDARFGGTYSTRAVNALAVVADEAPDLFPAMVDTLLANQPQEDGDGLSDDQIGALAAEVGVPAEVIERFTVTKTVPYTTSDGETGEAESRRFAAWTMAATQQADVDLGGLSTPTVLIDGERFEDWETPGALTTAIDAARAAE
jgi:protein-disulfide isomerase